MADHLYELYELAGALELRAQPSFAGENGAELLQRHFARVERREANGTVTVRDADAIRAYLRSSERLESFADGVPELAEPLVVRRRGVVFVAEKARLIRTVGRQTSDLTRPWAAHVSPWRDPNLGPD